MLNRLFFFTVIFILFTSCGTRRVTTTSKEIQTKIDTIVIEKNKTIIERFTDTLTIEKPCDSLGQLKSFKQSILVPQGKIDIFSVNGNIKAEIDLNAFESTIEKKWQKIYESKLKEDKEVIVKYKTPIWLIIYSLLITVICVLLFRIR
jgi:hypothetical protein